MYEISGIKVDYIPDYVNLSEQQQVGLIFDLLAEREGWKGFQRVSGNEGLMEGGFNNGRHRTFSIASNIISLMPPKEWEQRKATRDFSGIKFLGKKCIAIILEYIDTKKCQRLLDEE